MIDRIKDISRANPGELHKNLSDVEKQKLVEGLMNAILADEQKELKRSVTRRMADKIGDEGNVLPCRHFPVRSQRECMGCGCNHEEKARDISSTFRQADAVFEKYKQHGKVF